MTSTSGRLATGLKKCSPTNRLGRSQRRRQRLELDARRVGRDQRVRLGAAARARRTTRASRPLSRRSLRSRDPREPISAAARSTTQARGGGVGFARRAQAVCETARARAVAPARRTAARDPAASPTSPCSAHHAAMSPPIVPAPTTCTRRTPALLRREIAQALAQLEHSNEIATTCA